MPPPASPSPAWTATRAPVYSAAFSTDATRVVTASVDKTARVWDAASGKLIVSLEGHECPVYSAAFSTDATRVVTASDDKTARVWDAASGKLILRLDGHAVSVNTAAFSTDATRVVTASDDKTARVWDVHWLTQLHGDKLIDAVCREKLSVASRLTAEDVDNAAVLAAEPVKTLPASVVAHASIERSNRVMVQVAERF